MFKKLSISLFLISCFQVHAHDQINVCKSIDKTRTLYKIQCACKHKIFAAQLNHPTVTKYVFGGSLCCPFYETHGMVCAEEQFNHLQVLYLKQKNSHK